MLHCGNPLRDLSEVYISTQEEEPGQFFKASVVDLSKRRIRKVKRTPPSTEGGANPFLGVTLMPGSKEEKAEEVKQAEVEKPCEESADPEPKTTAVEVRKCSSLLNQ